MNLFIDSISSPASLIIFDEHRTIQAQKEIDIAFNESSKLSKEISLFLTENSFSYDTIDNVVLVNGPGSFTGVRTAVLIANTIAFQRPTFLTSLHYFELFHSYPIIKTSSKRDVFLQKSAKEEIQIVDNGTCLEYLKNENLEKYYGDFDKTEKFDIIHSQIPDYSAIIQTLVLQNQKKVTAYYIKKPNIS